MNAEQAVLSGDQALFMSIATMLAFLIMGAIFIGIYKGATKFFFTRKRTKIVRKIHDAKDIEILTWDKNGTPSLVRYKTQNNKGIQDTYEFV